MSTLADPAKVKRYTRLAIIFAFLLAFLWPLGGYFFWILGGAIAYFIFLRWYYSPRQSVSGNRKKNWERDSQPTWQRTAAAQAPPPQAVKNNVKLVFAIVGVFFAFLLVILIVVGIFSSIEPTENLSESTLQNNDQFINRGNSFFDQQQYDSALYYYKKVLAIEPKNQFALYNKALVFYVRKDYRTSTKIIRRCVQLHPTYGYAYYLLGDDYKAMNRPDTALICFEKAYEYEVRDAELLLNLGAGHQQIGNGSKAVQYYKEALERDSSLVEAYKQLALLDRPRSVWYQEQARRRQNP